MSLERKFHADSISNKNLRLKMSRSQAISFFGIGSLVIDHLKNVFILATILTFAIFGALLRFTATFFCTTFLAATSSDILAGHNS